MVGSSPIHPTWLPAQVQQPLQCGLLLLHAAHILAYRRWEKQEEMGGWVVGGRVWVGGRVRMGRGGGLSVAQVQYGLLLHPRSSYPCLQTGAPRVTPRPLTHTRKASDNRTQMHPRTRAPWHVDYVTERQPTVGHPEDDALQHGLELQDGHAAQHLPDGQKDLGGGGQGGKFGGGVGRAGSTASWSD